MRGLESHAAGVVFWTSLDHAQLLDAFQLIFLIAVQAELFYSLPDLASVSRRIFCRRAPALVGKASLAMTSEIAC